jgi:apolipoprotein N-acyltransferase
MARETLVRDPYEPRTPFWLRHEDYVWAGAVFVATVALTVCAFPPFKAPEFAYVFAAPAIFWAYRRPRLKLFTWTLFAAQALAWTILLGWLRHVTVVGLLLLGPFIGAWVGFWYLAVWWAMPRMWSRSVPVRMAIQLGLAGLWVVIEWSRTWVLGGFPWLVLAASQWQRPVILQIAASTGAGGVSFVLMAMNVGFAAYAHRLFFEGREGPAGQEGGSSVLQDGFSLLRKRSQEFWTAVFLLLACLCVFLVQVQPFARSAYSQPLARVAFVQPYIPQSVKWDPAHAPGILATLKTLTLSAGASSPDLILWPEASTPWEVKDDANMKGFVESLSTGAHAPILLGSIAVETKGNRESWFNGAFVVTPDLGLQHSYYAKRHLVPFGEYVPLGPVLGWISKFVPVGADATPGDDASPLLVSLPAGSTAFGVLICFEDIYPRLARESVLTGADVLFVPTNDAWYGEEGAASQHAAHSVLRAVETRRPVLRCGNGGWSGWIDEFGVIRLPVENGNGTVYFRGTETVAVTRDSRWLGRNSFYVQHGDWFVLVCAALALFGWAVLGARKAGTQVHPLRDEPRPGP